MLPDIKQLNIDLPEIQSIDAEEIVKAKLIAAKKQKKGNFIVEDTSLYIDCLNGLPGPLIKWFMKTLNNEGIANLVEKYDTKKATAQTIIGYADEHNMYFFRGEVRGDVVHPRGKSNFGWDPLFQPEEYTITYAEMDENEKNSMSHRRKALEKLKLFLNK